MKKAIFIITLIFLLVVKSFACINGDTYYLGEKGILYIGSAGGVPRGHQFYAQKEDLKELDSLYKQTKDIRYLSDQGLVLIALGEYKKAISFYQGVEKIAPNRYSTASNIGTAYELIGDNKQALFWIQKAVKLNEHSHYDSEWIHVNILKAKLGGDELINSKFLLGTDFGTDSIPHSSLSKAELDSLSPALFYQLNERVSFVKPKDKIVAQLMFDMGNLTFIRGGYKVALGDYALAKEYGYTDKLIDQRIKACAYQSTRPPKKYVPNIVDDKRNTRIYIYAGLGAVIGIGLAFVMVRRRLKKD
ncbi:tetratricopeptide repeat protein [Mucilaginibacter pedocola]|uniref:Uncharacterized protein n=1 Tax=Mucilaginibacter pedocola TaxID=1792845 RepID=A0A1S9P652_9SPHI|nr:tetratricopeptide repeat protein [Mucilaginibacter pedocola]OOQ56430.1 hypothetical protein BC343_18440 [Mucilaginibacter pedocola]